MLPFLKHKEASVESSDDPIERKPDEDVEDYGGFDACAEDLIRCIHSKDVKGVAEALRSAFELSKE